MDWLTTDLVSVILFFIGVAGLVIRKNMMISIIFSWDNGYCNYIIFYLNYI